MMHTHHIIPRHMGGTDAPDNLVSCTISEHAEYHRVLFDEHGHEWDRIAWLSLSGQINVDEARRLAQIEGARLGGSKGAAQHKRAGYTIGDWSRDTGHVRRIATPESCKKGGAASGRLQVESGKFEAVRKLGSIAGGKAAIKKMNTAKWRCVECGMVSHAGGIGNHQRGSGHEGKEAVCLL